MIMTASFTKFKDKDSFSTWMSHLPRKFSIEYRSKLLKILGKGDKVLWTEKRGINIL